MFLHKGFRFSVDEKKKSFSLTRFCESVNRHVLSSCIKRWKRGSWAHSGCVQQHVWNLKPCEPKQGFSGCRSLSVRTRSPQDVAIHSFCAQTHTESEFDADGEQLFIFREKAMTWIRGAAVGGFVAGLFFAVLRHISNNIFVCFIFVRAASLHRQSALLRAASRCCYWRQSDSFPLFSCLCRCHNIGAHW